MKDTKLRKIISNLEMANMNLHLVAQDATLGEEYSEKIDKAYSLIKESLVGLSEEEVVMEIYNHSDD